jgi:hypothetical protein
LHEQVRRAHVPPLHAEGTIDVEHGPGWLAALMIRLMHLPAAGLAQPVQLDVIGDGNRVVWTRRIAGSILRTRQHATGTQLVERSGAGRVAFSLDVDDGALLYRQSSMHVAGVPLPSSLSPRVEAAVSAAAEGWRVVVTVSWRSRMVCRYGGTIHES